MVSRSAARFGERSVGKPDEGATAPVHFFLRRDIEQESSSCRGAVEARVISK